MKYDDNEKFDIKKKILVIKFKPLSNAPGNSLLNLSKVNINLQYYI